jgi:hypothetical protein
MFALASWMLDAEDNNFLGLVVSRVIDQISISARYQFPYTQYLLLPSNMRKQDQTLKRFKNGVSDAERRLRIMLADIVGDLS